jgi:hypothetical protein
VRACDNSHAACKLHLQGAKLLVSAYKLHLQGAKVLVSAYKLHLQGAKLLVSACKHQRLLVKCICLQQI